MASKSASFGAGYELKLTRAFDAPRSRVFECLTEAKHFAKWWGPKDCRNLVKSFDVRPGGQILIDMATPDFRHAMAGQFIEIDSPRRIVFRSMAFPTPAGDWDLVTRNTLTLKERGGKTNVTLHVLVERSEGSVVTSVLSGMRAVWEQSFERLAAVLSAERS